MSSVGIVLELEVPIVCSILDNSVPTPTTMFGRRKILAISISLLAAVALCVVGLSDMGVVAFRVFGRRLHWQSQLLDCDERAWQAVGRSGSACL